VRKHNWATLSNCWKFLLSYKYRPGVERSAQWHQGETRGYGENFVNKDNQQPSPKVVMTMDAVHRLNGNGLEKSGLRYSRSLQRCSPTEELKESVIVLSRRAVGFLEVLNLLRMEQTLAYSN